jgi:hypothetical protein
LLHAKNGALQAIILIDCLLFPFFMDGPTTFPFANLPAAPRFFLLKATIAKFLSMFTPYNFNEIVGIAAFEKQLLHWINKEGITRGMCRAYDKSQGRKKARHFWRAKSSQRLYLAPSRSDQFGAAQAGIKKPANGWRAK